MKLDPELFKKILEAYENLPYSPVGNEIEIDGYSKDEVHYHQELLLDVEYILAEKAAYVGGNVYIRPIRLTYAGHEFLNLSRNSQAWDKAKDIWSKAGGFVLGIAKELLISLIRSQLNL